MVRFLKTLLVSVLLLGGVQASAQLVEEDHVDSQLVAEMTAAVPGESLWVAVRLVHQEGWHTYWSNPGDAGKPTTIDWSLPEGVTAGEIVWPVPQRFELPGDLVDYGFTGEIYLLTELTVPAGYSAQRLKIDADVQWLECEDICIPNDAQLSLDLPVRDMLVPDSQWAAGFTSTRNQQPRSDLVVNSTFTITEGRINLLVQALEPLFADARDVTFIPGEHRVFDYLSEPEVQYQLSSLQLSQGHHESVADNLEETLTGLLLVQNSDNSRDIYHIAASPEDVDLSMLGNVSGLNIPSISLGMAFVFALLGGMILNLMPCVFPVLSLKIISLVESSAHSRQQQVMHGLTYTAGVVLSFVLLAGILISIQTSGALVGWGFHLQAPWFVATMVILFLVMALSLSGVLTVGTRFMGLGSELSVQSGYRGSFFTGVLACVVASPCTAPLMAAALGLALTQPPAIALTIFAALGLGMALPFLALSSVPALGRLLPRPGRWMVVFKHVMAIPLYGTVIWLLWVLSVQVGIAGVVVVSATTALLAVALWVRQQATTVKEDSPNWRYGSISLLSSTLILALFVLLSPWLESRELVSTDSEHYEVFSQARLDELRAEGRPVFVNFTASWCVTCLANERVALSTDRVREAFREKGITYLKGDWSNNDPEISAVLARYQRAGVPLYLLFPADPDAPAQILNQFLTVGYMLESIETI